jgi:hypothetical protein
MDAMRRNMGIKPFDLILIVSLLIGALSLWVYDFIGAEAPSVVRIYNDQGLFREVPLHEERRVAIPGPLGESIVEVRSGEVFMEFSPCTNKLCIHTGKISRSGECILCLPNRVSVIISSRNTDVDALSY